MMWNPGKIVTALIFAVGLTAAGFSLWYHQQGGRRSLVYWGTQTAQLIARAPEITVHALSPADQSPAGNIGFHDNPSETADEEPATAGAGAPDHSPVDAAQPGNRPIRRLGVGGRFYVVTASADASKARGVSNIRRAMVLDATYRWDAAPETERPTWQYAMEFREGEQSAIVFFDFDTGRVSPAMSTETVALRPAAIDDWQSFFEEPFESVR
jgi:hypothetical protein